MAFRNGQNCQLKFMVKLLKFSWSKCNNFMLMVCARFHGHGQIPFSCSWSDSIPSWSWSGSIPSWSWSDSIFHAHGLIFVVMVNSLAGYSYYMYDLIPAGARGGSLGTRLAN